MEQDKYNGSSNISHKDAIPLIKEFSDFEILEEIGRGGMGIIYKAENIKTADIVAIKILMSKYNTYEEDLKRFQREAEYAIQLVHPNIIKTHSIGVVKGNYYIITDFLEGETLAQKMSRDYPTTIESCRIIHEVANGLEYAHNIGILHRDLKPENIMITADNQVKILDFGLARHVDATTRLTLTGTVLGTPAYMSPEQASGNTELLSGKSDIYSLGVIMYELLTGETPFKAESSIQLLRKVIDKDVPPIDKKCSEIPAALRTIVDKSLEKNPKHRYENITEFKNDIRAFLDNRPISARRRSRAAKLIEKFQRHRRIATIIAILCVNFILAIVGIHLYHVIQAGKLKEDQQRRFKAVDVNRWYPVIKGLFKTASQEEWYKKSKTWKRTGETLTGTGILNLPVRQEPFTLLSFRAVSEGKTITYYAGSSRTGRSGISVVFRIGRNTSPGDVNGVEVYRDSVLIARNYKCSILPETPVEYTVQIEDSRISVNIQNKTVVFFNGIMPLKLSGKPFMIDAGQERAEISSISLFCKKLGPRVISGDDFFREKKYPKAADLYMKVARDHPDLKVSREALFKAALCYEYMGRYARAVSVFSTFEKKDGPLFFRALCHIWLCYIHMKDIEKADRQYRAIKEDFSLYEMLSQVPFNALHSIFAYYVEEAEKAPDSGTAISYYEKAIDTADFLGLEQEAFDARNRIGEMYTKNKTYSKALTEFRRAQAEYPGLTSKCAWNQMKIAETYRLMNDIPGCIKEYQKVILRYPDQDIQKSWAVLWLAEIAISNKKVEDPGSLFNPEMIAPGLPSAAAHVLLKNGTVPDTEKIDPYFRNDICYFKAVSLLFSDRKEEAYLFLRKGLLYSRENDWPEILIRQNLDMLESGNEDDHEQPVF